MIFYVDGSAHPNPGPGGFGVVQTAPHPKENEVIMTYSEASPYTTNNEMELKAILWACCYAHIHDKDALIFSDSAYAINTLTTWMYGWARNGWVKSDGKTPENLKIIKAFYNLKMNMFKGDITILKIKGHAGNKFNELADKLATSA